MRRLIFVLAAGSSLLVCALIAFFMTTSGNPSSTPALAGAPPTPTPTPTYTPAPTPAAPGMQVFIGIAQYGPSAGEGCEFYTAAPTCTVMLGAPFDAYIRIMSLPFALPDGDHVGYKTVVLRETGAPSATGGTNHWPDCGTPNVDVQPDSVTVECDGIASSYTGLLATIQFVCDANGRLTMKNSLVDTAIRDSEFLWFAEGNPTYEPLDIECVPPLAYPGDQDGDGCADTVEMGDDESAGGRRNFLNPWDFYDTNDDRQVDLVNDLFAVAQAFGAVYPNGPYATELDRSPPHPGNETWHMNPPDLGIDLVTDVFGVAAQFGHRCS